MTGRAAASEAVVFAYLDEPPFCFPQPGGAALGSDVELVSEALRRLGIASFEMRLTSFAELLPGLIDGRWSITTPLFITPERRKSVDFSRPVWALGDGLLVRHGDEARFGSYAALARAPGARLVVVADQVQELSGLTAGIPRERFLRVATQEAAVQAVRERRAEAYASVAMAHRGFLSRSPDPGLAVIAIAAETGGREPAKGAFAFARSQGALRARFDAALDALIGSDWHRNMMARYGFATADFDLG
ncbi:ABC transporter substrate-binding protein [Bosea caraganae]|uniref:ABC transporter substrate-binding protein n=1 Tax=Bosea caraganae TaxID=2763117 RepID=A0A370L1V0_9HYPH|nr:transporter substrate-binding domain-containing protein [Bosea caraganae]RDJ21527.1 ABC transporter substrate-binding protein [Bosea caraganae]RDJ23495.1 ABC transporter substrate-binding protein [Bosea caraganae]